MQILQEALILQVSTAEAARAQGQMEALQLEVMVLLALSLVSALCVVGAAAV
jgi:hypothetical protein